MDQKKALQTLIGAGKHLVHRDQEINYETKAAIVAAINRVENDLKTNPDASTVS